MSSSVQIALPLDSQDGYYSVSTSNVKLRVAQHPYLSNWPES